MSADVDVWSVKYVAPKGAIKLSIHGTRDKARKKKKAVMKKYSLLSREVSIHKTCLFATGAILVSKIKEG